MFLDPSRKLKKLTQPAEPTVRETAKDNLDEKMKAILEDPWLNSYEKVKRYKSLLRRYLTLSKQGRDEDRQVTFHLPPEEPQQTGLKRCFPRPRPLYKHDLIHASLHFCNKHAP